MFDIYSLHCCSVVTKLKCRSLDHSLCMSFASIRSRYVQQENQHFCRNILWYEINGLHMIIAYSTYDISHLVCYYIWLLRSCSLLMDGFSQRRTSRKWSPEICWHSKPATLIACRLAWNTNINFITLLSGIYGLAEVIIKQWCIAYSAPCTKNSSGILVLAII